MDQRRFDFSNDESHPLYLQLNKADQSSLINLMSQLIIIVYQAQEIIHDEQSTASEQNQN